MSDQIKEVEIEELEVQNRKRNIATASSFVVGAIAGYVASRQMKSKKVNTLKFVVGGSLLFGLGYWGLTQKRTTKRKNAIREKRTIIEQESTNPASNATNTDTAPTTVVELTPTGTPKPNFGVIYKN